MNFTSTKLAGVLIVEMERHQDERGWFARTWCADEFAAHGLEPTLAQCSSSFNLKRGTLRGMHCQVAPHEEAKLVRCTRGSFVDVVLDLRVGSSTLHQWISVELSADNGKSLYIPKGCAHGFQTLEDNTEVFYSITERFHPDAAHGLRWNDPLFAIEWPLPDAAIVNDRDRSYPLAIPAVMSPIVYLTSP
jgi:dTDP-4-dehydrorhamnose 3,5-epimerase